MKKSQEKKGFQGLTDEQLELNRLISLTNESNLIKPHVEPKKDKYGRNLQTDEELE